MRTGEHGPDGLYDKFRVRRVSTGEEIDPDEEFVFVLRPEQNDHAALHALAVYADQCAHVYPGLARDIMHELDRIIVRGEKAQRPPTKDELKARLG